MSRKIKFRIWLPSMKSMGLPFDPFDSRSEHIGYLKESVFMQYTGLKDRVGIEIYEGDVLELNDGLHSTIAKVIWRKDLGRFEFNETAYSPDIFPFPMNKKCMKIIGNIYQNPELLKGGEER